MVMDKKIDKKSDEKMIETTRTVEFIDSKNMNLKPNKISPNPAETSKAVKMQKNFNRFKSRSNFFYRLGILGDWLVKRLVKRGNILAEVIYPNKNAQKYLISVRQTWVEVKEGDDVRFFDLSPLLRNPSRYVRYESGIPLVTFDWEYPHPIPITPINSDVVDLDTFSTLILKQRTKASAQPIKDFLDKVTKDFTIIKYASLVSAGCSAFAFAKLIGWI